MSALKYLQIENALIASMVGVEKMTSLEYLEMQGSFADPPDSYFASQEEMEAYYSPLNEDYTIHFSAARLLSLENLKFVGYDYSPLGMNDLIQHLDFQLRCNEYEYRMLDEHSIDYLVIKPDITSLSLYFADEPGVERFLLDMSQVEGLEQLESLAIGGVDLYDFDILKNCTNLTSRRIADTGLTYISCLAGCTKLEFISFSDNDIVDISFLANMPRLQEDNLNNNKIADISSLENDRYIKSLKIDNNPIKDLTTVLHMPSLGNLWIDGVPYVRSSELDDFIRNIHYRWESRE